LSAPAWARRDFLSRCAGCAAAIAFADILPARRWPRTSSNSRSRRTTWAAFRTRPPPGTTRSPTQGHLPALPRECRVADQERGYCGVRANEGGTYKTLVHSRVAAIHVDPVEKKPFSPSSPGRPPTRSPRPAATCSVASARTGSFRSSVPSRCRASRLRRSESSPRPRFGRPLHRLYLQRAGDLLRVHAGYRGCGRECGHPEPRYLERVYPGEAPARAAHAGGRREDRPEGVHGGVLPRRLRRAAEAGPGHARDPEGLGRLVRDRRPGRSHAERRRGVDAEAVRVGRRASRPETRSTSRAFTPCTGCKTCRSRP